MLRDVRIAALDPVRSVEPSPGSEIGYAPIVVRRRLR